MRATTIDIASAIRSGPGATAFLKKPIPGGYLTHRPGVGRRDFLLSERSEMTDKVRHIAEKILRTCVALGKRVSRNAVLTRDGEFIFFCSVSELRQLAEAVAKPKRPAKGK